MDAEMLKKELAKVELPADAEAGELQKIRDKYFDDIFTERLYGYLSPKSQIAMSRSAVYGVPVTMEGLAVASGENLEEVEAFAHEWKDRAFAYEETGKSLWSVYGLLRGWLLAKCSPEERQNAHKAAGDFLVETEQQNQEEDLGLSRVDCLMEARSQYLIAEELELARKVTDRLSGFFTRSGFYDGVRMLNAELLDYEEHPSPMSWIARTYSAQGDYNSAQNWYQRSLKACGDSNPKEISIAWHGLATIDVDRGEYGEAIRKYQTSLKIAQEIGNRVGEAATFYRLGFLAKKQSKAQEGLRLVALCYLIDASIGQGDAQNVFKVVSSIASELKYTKDQLDVMLKEVEASCGKDQGKGLIEAAFDKV